MSSVDEPARPAPVERAGSPGTTRGERSDHSPLNWLLVVPLLATLIPPLFNRIDPQLLDIPFFYWYQLAAIGIGVATTLIVYRGTRG